MLKILDAKIDDLDFIYNLSSENFGEEKLSKKSIEDYILNKTMLDYVKIIQDNDEYIGYIIYRINDIAELISICIKKENRKMSYGTYLLKLMFFTIETFNTELKEKTTAEKYNKLCCKKVLLEVRKQNINAIKFYKREKFNEIDIRKNYYKNPLDDCVVMEKIIC